MKTVGRHTAAVLCMALALCSCGGNARQGQDGTDYYMVASSAEDSVSAVTGVRSLQTIEASIDTVYRGEPYHSYVVRRADESLPQVSDESGARYLDNRITLRLTSGSSKVLERDFLKSSFAQYLDSDFLEHALLEGLTFDKVVPDGLQYIASVGYPESDLYVPFSVVVSARGDVTIRKSDLLDSDDADSISQGQQQ